MRCSRKPSRRRPPSRRRSLRRCRPSTAAAMARPRRRSVSGGGSAAGRVRMDERVKQAGLVLVGAVALTAERADELAETLAERGGMQKEEVRGWIDDATTRWRGDAVRVGERAGATLHAVLRELGLVTPADWEDLRLRVGQRGPLR